MAAYQKRKNKDGTVTHRVLIRRQGKPPVSKSFPSKAAAVAWATRTEGNILAGKHGTVHDATFGDLLERYAEDVSLTKKGAKKEAIRIRAVVGNDDPAKGRLSEGDALARVRLRDLGSASVAEWRDRRLKVVSPASVDRDWNLFSAACTVAVGEWKWLHVNPFKKSEGAQRPPTTRARDRLATEEELECIKGAATTPADARVLLTARWALETGMRSGEILGLKPERVDTTRRVARLVDTWADRKNNNGQFSSIKTGADREVPLSAEAVRVWEETGGLGFELTDAARDVCWRDLCRRAGVEDLHFHDLRHNAATRWSRVLNPFQLCRMFGWKNMKQALTYYNESAADVALKM